MHQSNYMIKSIGLGIFSFLTFIQTIAVDDNLSFISRIEKLGLTAAALLLCWLLWNKQNKTEIDRDSRIDAIQKDKDQKLAAKDDQLLTLYKSVAESMANDKMVKEKMSDTLDTMQETLRNVNITLVRMDTTLEKIETVRNVMGVGGKNG